MFDRRSFVVLGALAMAGCATTTQGKLAVKRLDHQRYEITDHVIGSVSGPADVQAHNNETATAYCAEKGAKMSIISRTGYGGLASQDILIFQCGDVQSVHRSQPPAKPS